MLCLSNEYNAFHYWEYTIRINSYIEIHPLSYLYHKLGANKLDMCIRM